VAELKAELCSLEWLIMDLLSWQMKLCFRLVCIESATAVVKGENVPIPHYLRHSLGNAGDIFLLLMSHTLCAPTSPLQQSDHLPGGALPLLWSLLTSLSEVFHQVYTKLPQLSIMSLCCLSSRFFVYKISCKNNQPEILITSEYIISIVVLPSTCICCFPSGKVTEMIELFPVTALHSSAHSVIFHMCTNDKKTQSIKLRDQPESLTHVICLNSLHEWLKTLCTVLAIGTWNITSLVWKEPELVQEVERYQLDIVGLTSTHSSGSGTSLLERGVGLFSLLEL
uniref:Uncharacterized protein n=1 Tax=Mola mola TaxID=94237 RepID=A0A3Q4B154_MOLML